MDVLYVTSMLNQTNQLQIIEPGGVEYESVTWSEPFQLKMPAISSEILYRYSVYISTTCGTVCFCNKLITINLIISLLRACHIRRFLIFNWHMRVIIMLLE